MEVGVTMPENQKSSRFFSIGSVSKQLEVPTGTLRQWEQDFELNIPRTSNNVRFYTEDDIELLHNIKKLFSDGSSVETIRQQLLTAPRTAQAPSVPGVAAPDLARAIQDVHERVLHIQRLLETMPDILEAAIAGKAGTKQKNVVAAPVEAEAVDAEKLREAAATAPEATRVFVAAQTAPETNNKPSWRRPKPQTKKAGKR